MIFRRYAAVLLLIPLLTTALTGCAPSSVEPGDGKLRVVATTTIVGDVVHQVAGDLVDLTVLLPVGADPHTFDPRPQDVAAVADAQVIFASGLGLEEFLEPLLDNAGSRALVVRVSDGIAARRLTGMAGGEETPHETGADPHVWMDPNNVLVWTENIAQALSAADPAHAGRYAANASTYEAQLQELDSWIREQVAQIPAGNRKLVTDHMVFGYFAERYGFEQVGAIIPGFSTGSTPSAQELAAIEDAIREYGVRAVLTGRTVNPALAERVAEDTGVKLALVYTGSLSAADGPADTYLNFMNYNVSTIVEALK